jgi:hypothetical protein
LFAELLKKSAGSEESHQEMRERLRVPFFLTISTTSTTTRNTAQLIHTTNHRRCKIFISKHYNGEILIPVSKH